jgi:hypothetical protein
VRQPKRSAQTPPPSQPHTAQSQQSTSDQPAVDQNKSGRADGSRVHERRDGNSNVIIDMKINEGDKARRNSDDND